MTPEQEGRSSSEDARLPIQSLIDEGVRLVLALREGEETVTTLQRNDPLSYPSDMEYILQKVEVDKTKRKLAAAVARLAALPHTPVQSVRELVDLGPLRAWMEAHRAQFDALKRFCEYRPPPPMELEEGEVHPRVDALLAEVRDVEARVERLVRAQERRREPREAVEFRRRAELLDKMHRESTAEFSRVMSKVDFSELSEEGQRVAIQQHVLKVARETLDYMLKIKQSDDNVESIFWLQPLVRWRRAMEEGELEDGLLGANDDLCDAISLG